MLSPSSAFSPEARTRSLAAPAGRRAGADFVYFLQGMWPAVNYSGRRIDESKADLL